MLEVCSPVAPGWTAWRKVLLRLVFINALVPESVVLSSLGVVLLKVLCGGFFCEEC